MKLALLLALLLPFAAHAEEAPEVMDFGNGNVEQSTLEKDIGLTILKRDGTVFSFSCHKSGLFSKNKLVLEVSGGNLRPWEAVEKVHDCDAELRQMHNDAMSKEIEYTLVFGPEQHDGIWDLQVSYSRAVQ